MATTQVEKLVQLYRSVAAIPSLASARILDATYGGLLIQSIWTQRSLERKIIQRFQQNYIFKSDLTLFPCGFSIDVTPELMSAVTENAERRAVLRQIIVDNSKKQVIEIWDKQHILKTYDLSALDVHGDVYTDNDFGSFEWSPDNTKLLYIAEKKLPKSEPFYKQKPLNKKDKEDEEITVGNEYIYKPHWGEQLVGKHRPAVVILDTTTDTITALSGIPDELSPGQVIWTKEQDIIGVAWKHEPRYLGLVVCTNRISWVFLLKDGNFRKLSNDGCAVHSPRLSPDGNYLVWLERKAGGAHHNAHRLMLQDFKSEEPKNDILVDIVQTSKTIYNNKQFYGIYGRLPRQCWCNNEYLAFSTPQKHNIFSYIVNIHTKDIFEIQKDKNSLKILDIKSDVIVFSSTSLTQPPSIVITYFNVEQLVTGNAFEYANSTALKIDSFENIKYEFNEYTYDNDDEIKQFNFIYFGPKSGKDMSIPLIIVPHGGPHSSYTNIFVMDYAFFILAGFALVLVNYRGSTGMGSATVEYLNGKVGDTDVKDCITARTEAIKKYLWLDPKRIGLRGGSHGGFLVTHLSGQVPDMFKAVVAKNPVIDIANIFGISDIPDCRNALTKEEKIIYLHDVCAAETGFPYNYEFDGIAHSTSDNVEMFIKMMKCSPIIHVNKVKAPTLICIGINDLRVPPYQGKMWYNRLKANNVKTKMLVYDDNHPLSSGPAEIDHLINDCLWLIENVTMIEDTETKDAE